MNRCLTEGRRAFAARLAGIEAGSECERLLPLVSAPADREASADELRELRPAAHALAQIAYPGSRLRLDSLKLSGSTLT